MSASPQSQSPQQQSYDEQLHQQQQNNDQLQENGQYQEQENHVDDYEQNNQQDNNNNPINSGISSPDKRNNIFDNLEESPFKNVNKDYGDKYNKVIDRLRESTSLNDLARKYNKIQLPVDPVQQNNSNHKFTFESSEAKQIIDMNTNSLRMSFEAGFNNNNTNNNNIRQPLQQSQQQSNYQTPLKTEGSQISYNMHKKNDSGDFKNSFLSKKTMDSAIPGILAQIQQKQQRYKSPSNLMKNTYSNLLDQYKKPVSLKDYVSKGNENRNTIFASPKNNLSNDRVQIQEPNSIEKSSKRGAKQLRKNFQSFLQDINLGGKHSYNRTVVSPKAFVRQQSPLRNNNSKLFQQKKPVQQQSQQQLGGLDSLISKIQQKKNTVLHRQEASPMRLSNAINNSGGNSRSLGINSYLGTGHTYHPQHSGKMHEFEQEMDNMRLNSLFSMNSKKSENGSMRLSSIHSKLKY